MPKFDYIIQNPPYNKIMHIDFFKKGLDMLADDGKMTIIEPATWLINIKKDGNAKKIYNPLKDMLSGIVDRVSIQNLNYVFGTCMFVPFSITYVNKSKSDNDIIFDNFNIHKHVNSLYDCNLVGEYNIIWNILSKIKASFNDDMLIHHIKCPDVGEYYFRYAVILASLVDTLHSKSDCFYINDYYEIYYTPCIHKTDLLSKTIKIMNEDNVSNKKYIVGTYQELKTFKTFILESDLSKFINICMCIDMHNNSLNYIPWCIDYTDDSDLFDKINLTSEEIQFIKDVVYRFKRSSSYVHTMVYGEVI